MNIQDARSDTHAVKLLKADHREVDQLFRQFEATDNKARQVSLVTEICEALIVHAEIEERLFYVESRQVLDEAAHAMVDEAFVEHASLKGLIMKLDGMQPTDPLFKAYVTVLKEYVQHHAKEEESEYFPRVEKTDLDLEALGARMKRLQDELMSRPRPEMETPGAVVAKLLATRPLSEPSMTPPSNLWVAALG